MEEEILLWNPLFSVAVSLWVHRLGKREMCFVDKSAFGHTSLASTMLAFCDVGQGWVCGFEDYSYCAL